MNLPTYTLTPAVNSDADYEQFEQLIKHRVANNTKPLFTTDVNPDLLWLTYLTNLPSDRQHYNCNCCRRFIQKYGGLVTIEKNSLKPLLWTQTNSPQLEPQFFRAAIDRLWAEVRLAKVTGVFLSKERVWGTPESVIAHGGQLTTKWTHLCGYPQRAPYNSLLKTAEQQMAEHREEHRMLKEYLSSLDRKTLTTAQKILQQGALYRSEKAESIFQWLLTVATDAAGLCGDELDVYLWSVVAEAPVGYCHVKNTVLGTLLEDIESGMSLTAISERWKNKLNPLQYQRPTAAPTVGNVAAAEKIFDKLGLEKSLQRRYARLDEIPAEVTIWRPAAAAPVKVAKPGLFSELLPESKKDEPLRFPADAMSWAKFARNVLPTTQKMLLRVPSVGSFYGLLTAVDMDAPAIIQWDRPEKRNPFSWYFYNQGSLRSNWDLDSTAAVTAIFEAPSNWYTAKSHHGDKLFFALDGCKDNSNSSLCLFPEVLRSELREVRSTIESYSKTRRVERLPIGVEGANGISGWPLTFDVTTAAGVQTITIDRLE